MQVLFRKDLEKLQELFWNQDSLLWLTGVNSKGGGGLLQ